MKLTFMRTMSLDPLSLPKLSRFVNDFSDVLSSEEIRSLDNLFAEHEKNTGEQIVTVLVPHREGHELREIGLKIFNENGIGKKGVNNGILLIIATQESKIRIITGKGMEIDYSEMRCREIIEKDLRPLLDKKKYYQLISTWSDIVEDPESGIQKDDETNNKLKSDADTGNFTENSPSTLPSDFRRSGFSWKTLEKFFSDSIKEIIGIFIGIFICIIAYGTRRNRSHEKLGVFKTLILVVCAIAVAGIVHFIVVSIAMKIGGKGLFYIGSALILLLCLRTIYKTHASGSVDKVAVFIAIAYSLAYISIVNSSNTCKPTGNDDGKENCTVTVFNYKVDYIGSAGGSSYSSTSRSSSSSSSSSRGSFGGGGGSSNGGGAGD